jgi:hypothetical protein
MPESNEIAVDWDFLTEDKKKVKQHPLIGTWRSMLYRCDNPNYREFAHYGGRGIKVCIEWYDFNTFCVDMGERPEGHTLDRIDNEKGYCKENCRWATSKEQNSNRGYSNDLGLRLAIAGLKKVSDEDLKKRAAEITSMAIKNKARKE